MTRGQGKSGSGSGPDWWAPSHLRRTARSNGFARPLQSPPSVDGTGGEALLLLQESATSDPVALGIVRRRVRDAMVGAGLRADAVEAMEVAVGEVLSNVCRHAYNGDAGPVSIAVFRHSYALSVLIADGGDATDVPKVPRQLPPFTRGGGRGLYLVGRLADDVQIRVSMAGHGLVVRLSKRLRSTEAAIGGEQTA